MAHSDRIFYRNAIYIRKGTPFKSRHLYIKILNNIKEEEGQDQQRKKPLFRMILNLYNSLDITDIILIFDNSNNLNIYIMETLKFVANKKLTPKDEPYRMGIESVNEDNEIRYYHRGIIVFLLKENHKGWTFAMWIMNERIEVFFSRGKYEIVDLDE